MPVRVFTEAGDLTFLLSSRVFAHAETAGLKWKRRRQHTYIYIITIFKFNFHCKLSFCYFHICHTWLVESKLQIYHCHGLLIWSENRASTEKKERRLKSLEPANKCINLYQMFRDTATEWQELSKSGKNSSPALCGDRQALPSQLRALCNLALDAFSHKALRPTGSLLCGELGMFGTIAATVA